jgi:GNAT superfamily N-acetyltransferase
MERGLIVREATLMDIPQAVDAAARAHAEAVQAGSIYARLPFCAQTCGASLSALVGRPDALLLLATLRGQIVGGVAAVMAQHWASSGRYAHELALVVAPEARGRLVGLRLMRELVSWARRQGSPLLVAGASSGIDAERTQQIYRRVGLLPAGHLMGAFL